MKIKNLSILTGFAGLAFTANALLPKTELQPRWLRVTDVERTDSATRVGIRLQNIPNYWVRYNSSARLIAYSYPMMTGIDCGACSTSPESPSES